MGRVAATRGVMDTKGRSIGAEIARLAALTGAPGEFVERIRALFSNKGISLDGDSAPYQSALEQAFRREQSIRLSAQQTRRNLDRLQSQLSQFNEACRRQIGRLKELQGAVERREAERQPSAAQARRIQIVEIDERALRVRRVRAVMVPGPKELQ
jgi:hypothetical protein